MFMKTDASHLRLTLTTGVFALLPLCIGLAADQNSTDTTSAQPAVTPTPVVSVAPAPTKLPYGVEDVLKLSHAQIGDEIILNYVHNSGTIYNLAPKDIVYLKTEGVSDKVINTMLDQRKRVEFAAQSAQGQAAAVPNAPTVADANMAPAAPGYTDPNAIYAEAPLTPPASSVYVMPYSPGYYAPYYYGGYYGPYYGGPYWYGPSIGFGFRFGGHGGFHGGFHGGGHGSFAGRGSGGHR